jgi:hypothetical protein
MICQATDACSAKASAYSRSNTNQATHGPILSHIEGIIASWSHEASSKRRSTVHPKVEALGLTETENTVLLQSLLEAEFEVEHQRHQNARLV